MPLLKDKNDYFIIIHSRNFIKFKLFRYIHTFPLDLSNIVY